MASAAVTAGHTGDSVALGVWDAVTVGVPDREPVGVIVGSVGVGVGVDVDVVDGDPVVVAVVDDDAPTVNDDVGVGVLLHATPSRAYDVTLIAA